MSWYCYEDAREQKARVLLEIMKRRKRGEAFEAVTVTAGRTKIANTFWGSAWCKHLETHQDYEHRLPRGRSYLRQGNVYNLKIEPGKVTADVAGSSLYEVSIQILPLTREQWTAIKEECAGKVGSLLDLLGGKLGDHVLQTITNNERGLFPKTHEIRFSCTCPDSADMCKHVAATLYAVGVKLDAEPELFFVLRSADPAELLANTAQETLAGADTADGALAGEDLSALFGIDLAPAVTPDAKAEPPAKAALPAKGKKSPNPAAKKPAQKVIKAAKR